MGHFLRRYSDFKVLIQLDKGTKKRQQYTMKEAGKLKMEKIETDCKWTSVKNKITNRNVVPL